MDATGTSSVWLEPVDPFSALTVGNDTNSFVASSNDQNSNDFDEEDDNSSGDYGIQELMKGFFNLSSIFIA